VYLYYRGPCSKESALLETTSNAAAAGRSRSDALRRALLEGIERDSFLVYWMSKCAPNRILLDSIKNKNIRALLDEIQECRLDVTILDVTTDLKIPTICSVLIDRFGGVAVSLTLASDFNIENAILKTLRDAVRHGVSSASRVEKSPLCDEENYTNILSIKDRRRLWSHQCMIPRIQFFISEGKEKSLKEMVKEVPKVNRSDELAYLKKILRDKGYRWYAVDVTAPAARREKIYVVKVILPDLIPVFFSERRRPIGISRLYSAPVAMGIHKKALTESELNSLPHPFL
jgi:ribosomal protein S12 methylthiotransferase accessory factor